MNFRGPLVGESNSEGSKENGRGFPYIFTTMQHVPEIGLK